jgi:hypothetical protein
VCAYKRGEYGVTSLTSSAVQLHTASQVEHKVREQAVCAIHTATVAAVQACWWRLTWGMRAAAATSDAARGLMLLMNSGCGVPCCAVLQQVREAHYIY